MGGNSTISTSEPRIGALRIQQSSYGLTLPIIWGRTRISGNLGWYGDFSAIAHTERQDSGGKGGGGVTQENTTYTYTAAVMMMLAEGPILGVRSAWKGKQQFTGTGTSTKSTQVTEAFTLPVSVAPTATTANHATFISNISVEQFYPGDGSYDGNPDSWVTLTNGIDYTISAGVYTFCAPQSGVQVRITYTYTETIASVSALGQLNLSLANGYQAQPVWGYLTTNHPDQAVGYSGVAYVYGNNYSLTGNAEVDNHTFEVDSTLQFSSTIPDANPADIALDFLVNSQYGADFGRANVGSMSAFTDCSTAQGIFLSPALTEQKPAIEFLRDLAQMTNCGLVWSEGLLKFIPYCDATITGNGVTYTPDTSPIYDLTDDDFLPDGADGPIHITRKSPADSYNRVQIEFLNRDNQYNVEIVEAKDQANIEAFGLRSMEVLQMHAICDTAIAKIVAQLILQRALYVRNQYEFKLGWKYITLEPMDLVTLTDSGLGLLLDPVRIIEIHESPDGALSITAEDFPHGSASATRYPAQSGSGFSHDYNVTPGSVTTPAIFQAPRELSVKSEGLDIWVAVGGGDDYGGCEIWASLDDSTYKKFGVINGKSRYGTLTATLGSHPAAGQYVESMTVHLVAGGQLLSGTQSDLDLLNTLCYVDGEYMAYKTAGLVAADTYSLTTLSRGAYSSGQASHVSGATFVRCDEGIAKLALPDEYVDKTVYLKFLAFNKYSGATQALSDVTAYTYSIDGRFIRIAPANVSLFHATSGKLQITLDWTYGNPHYNQKVQIYASSGTDINLATLASEISYPTTTWTHIGLGSGVTLHYWIRVVDDKGNASEWSSMVTGTTSALTATDLQDAIINTAKFAAGIEPVAIVSSLPSTSGYTGVKVVFLTTDGKLYRYVSGAWTVVVPATDISGQLSNSQIADLAAAKLTGQIVSTQITDNSISTAKIQAGAITTNKIATNAVTASEIAAGSITASKIASDTITANEIAANAITANELAANSVVAGKIAAAAVSATEIAAGSIVASKLAASNVITLSAQIADATILSAKIVDLSVTSAKIADLTVGTQKITNGAVTTNASATGVGSAATSIVPVAGSVVIFARGIATDFVGGAGDCTATLTIFKGGIAKQTTQVTGSDGQRIHISDFWVDENPNVGVSTIYTASYNIVSNGVFTENTSIFVTQAKK